MESIESAAAAGVTSGGRSEFERLLLLGELELFDTMPEDSFDAVTALAAETCGAPISLISLVGASRQAFKSAHGTDLAGTPRSVSFCSHAIETVRGTNGSGQPDLDSIFEVVDTIADGRFSNNPLVLEDPKIRHYAGLPLRPTGGPAVGTLCVISPEPRQLSDSQRLHLIRLGVLAEDLLRLRLQANAEARAKQLAERSQRKYRYLAENAIDHVFVHDADLTPRYVSPSVSAYLGYSEDEMATISQDGQISAPDQTLWPREILDSLTVDQPTSSLRTDVVLKDGSTRPVSIEARAIVEDGQILEYHSTLRDVSDLVNYERELEAVNTTLESLLQERTQMVQGIAHDLAAPVAAMRVTVESLRSQITEPAMLKQAGMLEEFALSVEAFLSDLRLVAEPASAGHGLRPRIVNVGPAIARAIAQVPDVEDGRLSVDLADVMAYVDPHALSRIATNLLTNAVRHTPEGTHIDVSVFRGHLPDGDEVATVRISDLGPGFPNGDYKRAFEPYVTSAGRRSGLGLAITRALVDGLNGSISIEPNHPSGTTVTVTLPPTEPDPSSGKAR